MRRYTHAEIIALNSAKRDERDRECRICHRSDHMEGTDLCRICSGLIGLSRGIISRDNAFYTIKASEGSIPGAEVYKDRFMEISDGISADAADNDIKRVYCKNSMYHGHKAATKLWVGDYNSGRTLGDIVSAGKGIKRMGVLRADIDNLGQAFSMGFEEKYKTLSRTAVFSRKLSLFFKLYINGILQNGEYSIDPENENTKENRPRSASIIYAGGDDLFIVGAWKDVLEFAVDLHLSFKRFTQGILTFSAGFGMYRVNYPISYIAEETGELEDAAKSIPGKNAVALFEASQRYSWDTFIDSVMGEKYKLIYDFFGSGRKSEESERGSSYMYNLLELMRGGESINLARLAYFLARLAPGDKAPEEKKQLYRDFSRAIYGWKHNKEECMQAITAIYIYDRNTRGALSAQPPPQGGC